MSLYRIKQGECLVSIAKKHQMTLDKIWSHSNNSKLRNERKNPNLLYPGDQLFIPDVDVKEVTCNTDSKHQFLKLGTPARLMINLNRNGKPLESIVFKLTLDGKVHQGETGKDGLIDIKIPPEAKVGKLEVGDGKESYTLMLAGLDPISKTSGVQGRLYNLGFSPGPIDGVSGPLTEAAVKKFQQQVGAKIDGIFGPETSKFLEKKYGC